MKKIVLTIGCLAAVVLTNAQHTLEWVKKIGSTSVDWVYSMATDASGNVYSTGKFGGQVDFDPGTGFSNLKSAGDDDIFISKLDASGNFVWAKSFGAIGPDEGHGIAVDAQGNIYITGQYLGSVDFDPSTGSTILTSNTPINSTAADIFIAKYDANAKLIWAKSVGGKWGDAGWGITVDGSGNVFTTGLFMGTGDFDPGTGTFDLVGTTVDAFILKLDSKGDLKWAKNITGPYYESGRAIALDAAGNVYTSGYFFQTGDFDPDATAKFNLTPADSCSDVYISKLDANGKFIWAKQLGGKGFDYCYSLALDASGNVYTTGSFEGVADFDPDATKKFNLTPFGKADIFISKLSSAGAFGWAKQMGGEDNDIGNAIAVDDAGNVYTTGSFKTTGDFDPGSSSYPLTTGGYEDIFISKLDASGNFGWAKRTGGIIYDVGQAITVNNNGSTIYTGGYFYGTVDFDPDAPVVNLVGSGAGDIYIEKMSTTGAGIQQIGNKNSIHIYPNPSNGILNIDLENGNKGEIKIQVLNSVGQIVLEEISLIPHSQFNIQHLPKGLYFVKVMGNDEFIASQKIIKE